MMRLNGSPKRNMVCKRNMKKQLGTLIILLFGFLISNAQEKTRPNSLSIEIGKTGLLPSLIFDHQFPIRFGIRAGGGYNSFYEFKVKTAGGGLYYLFGNKKRHLETGIDFYYLNTYDSNNDDQVVMPLFYPNYSAEGLYTSINLGYRSCGTSTMFRIGFSPGVFEGEFIP